MAKIRILIVDDHKLFREGIISILSKHEDIEIVASASDGPELYDALKATQAHIVLMDISLPESNGLDHIKRLKEEYPRSKVIVLTMHEEGQYVVKAVRNGAYGYLLKNTNEDELLLAIKTVFSGKKYFNKNISELMIGNIALAGDAEKRLSNRETEILQEVANGLTTKEIAARLCVSTRTVETHRFNMMKKLNVQNTAELINKAIHLGII